MADFDRAWASLKQGLSKKELKDYPELAEYNPSKYKSSKEKYEALYKIVEPIADSLVTSGQDPSEGLQSVIDFVAGYPSTTPGSSTSPLASPSTSPASPLASLECPSPLDKSKLGITFEDIAGNKDAKKQLIVGYIYPFTYTALFPDLSKGVLLYGSPGTGKTLLAKAATAEVPNAVFFDPKPSDIKGKFLGETEKNINKVFSCAENETKSEGKISIIFFDEFDSIGKDRRDSEGMAASVNALLQEMDGIVARPKVSVLAATNYPWLLDEAIIRRFPVRIFVKLPDPIAIEFKVREALAKMYTPPGEGIRDSQGKIKSQEFYDAKGKDHFPQRPGGYMDAIKEYGNFKGSIVEAGAWFSKSSQSPDKSVSDKFISDLVKKLGPTDKGLEVLKDWENGKVLSCEDSRIKSNEPIFGYSPSDIDQIMKAAIKTASLRALSFKCQNKTYTVNGKKTVYKIAIHDFEKGQKATEIADKSLIITFDIRESDINEAIKMNGSTVNNLMYYKMLYYSKYKEELTC